MPTTSQPTQKFTQADGVTLKEYVESRLNAQQEFFCAKLAAIQQATTVATTQLEHRLAGMNEFRDTLKDQASRLATRAELQAEIDRINTDIADLKKSRDEATGKASQTSVLVSLLIGVAGLVVGLVGLLGG